jgi:hypothetical protein
MERSAVNSFRRRVEISPLGWDYPWRARRFDPRARWPDDPTRAPKRDLPGRPEEDGNMPVWRRPYDPPDHWPINPFKPFRLPERPRPPYDPYRDAIRLRSL